MGAVQLDSPFAVHGPTDCQMLGNRVIYGYVPVARPALGGRWTGCGLMAKALALGARYCRFESCHPDHLLRNNLRGSNSMVEC